jgi:hypothetical protein
MSTANPSQQSSTITYTLPGGKEIKLPKSQNHLGKSVVQCDLCGGMITVTQDGSLKYFASHRDSQNCKQAQKKLQQKLQEKINEEEIHKMLTEVTGQSSNPSSRSFSYALLSGCPYYIMIGSALTAFFNGTTTVSNVDSTLLTGFSEESLSSSSSMMTPTAESGLTTPTGGPYPRATSPDHGSVYSDKETESLAASIASMNLSSLYLSQSEDEMDHLMRRSHLMRRRHPSAGVLL